GAVVLRGVEGMLLDEVKPLAQLEGGADGLSVVLGDAEQAVDAVVAFGILDAAGAHERSVYGLRGGPDFDGVAGELAELCGCAVGVYAELQIAGNRRERRSKFGGVFDVVGGERSGGELQAGGVDSSAGAEEVHVQRSLQESGVARAACANGVVGVGAD